MPPHGRRRLGILDVLLSIFFLFTATASAASAVLGLDLGTEYIKAALVKPGIPLEIVLTKDSKRKELAAVAFKPLRTRINTAESDSYPERVYGGDAMALSARYPSDVYPNLKPLLGLKFSNTLVSEYGGTYSGLQMVEVAETETVGFKSDCFDKEERPWLVEELLAMEMKNVKGNAETMAGKGSIVSDVVITIPSFYTVEERRAVSMAADLAGLRVLSLISDGLSIGLNYATSRTFPLVNDGEKPEIHLVYDMGAGSTSATVLKFQGRIVKDIGKYNKTIQEVQVLGTSWDKTFGGDSLNRLILDDMIDKIVSTTHMKNLNLTSKHIKSHGRTMAKLWKEAERIRQVLSANTETSSSLEGLYYEDFTFKYKLSRAGFERLASGNVERVRKPLVEALQSAKLSLADLESLILHGGAVRTPFVQKQLEAVVKDSEKIRNNVNADEAAVFGAAFKAAAINPSFRVKEIRAADNSVYPVLISWTADGKEKHQKLFVPNSPVGNEKQVSIRAVEDLLFSLSQQISTESNLVVSSVRTINLTESVKKLHDDFGCDSADISTKFAIRLSPMDGLPEVMSGSVNCEFVESETKRGGVVEGVKDLFGFGLKKGDQEPLKENSDAGSSTSTPISASVSETFSDSSAASTPNVDLIMRDVDSDEKPMEVKKSIKTMHIGFSVDTSGTLKLKQDDLQQVKKRISAFDKSDRSRVFREEMLNTLEGYTYKIRDVLEDEGFVAASSEKLRNEIETMSDGASMWLYGEGAEASRDVLKERLDSLRGLVEPIQKRKDEAKKRPHEVQKLKDALAQADTMVQMIRQQKEAQLIAESAEASKASESSDTQTAASSTPMDEFAELDDDPATATPPIEKPASTMPAPIYSEEDLSAFVEKQELIQKWLDEKLAEQEKLLPVDDPIILSSDLSAKSEEISKAVMSLLTKKMQNPPKPKPKKTKKTKTAKSTKTTPTADTSMASSAGESGETVRGTPGSTGGTVDDLEGFQKVTDEEIEEAMAEQKLKAEKTGKNPKTKPIAKGNSKKKGDKGTGKSTVKEKGKVRSKEEL